VIALGTVYCSSKLTTAAAMSDGLYSIRCAACERVYPGWPPLLRDGHVIQTDPSNTLPMPAQRT
jgi:hypothetical protein